MSKDHMYTQTVAVVNHTGTAADEDAVTSVTVHQNAILIGVIGFVKETNAAGYANIELSASGNYQLFTTDNPDTIMGLHAVAATAQHQNSIGLCIPFLAGDKIYINVNASAHVCDATFTLYWIPWD